MHKVTHSATTVIDPYWYGNDDTVAGARRLLYQECKFPAVLGDGCTKVSRGPSGLYRRRRRHSQTEICNEQIWHVIISRPVNVSTLAFSTTVRDLRRITPISRNVRDSAKSHGDVQWTLATPCEMRPHVARGTYL